MPCGIKRREFALGIYTFNLTGYNSYPVNACRSQSYIPLLCLVAGCYLTQGCVVYNKYSTSQEDIRNGLARPIQVVNREGKIFKFDRLEFKKDKIFGVKSRGTKSVKVPIPRERIQAIRMNRVKVILNNGQTNYYKYLVVDENHFTGITEKNHQVTQTILAPESISKIFLLDEANTAIGNILFIAGGGFILAFLIFPILVGSGILPKNLL